MGRHDVGRGAAPAGLVATRHSGGAGAPPGAIMSPRQELPDDLASRSGPSPVLRGKTNRKRGPVPE
jgi:hypothetical protein